MLNKLEFNNLVITNKKLVQQARAQTIAKLVQKLRKLKIGLEKQPENEKHKQRLRKNVECMSQLKALKYKDIMRSLLLQDDNKNNAVLTNGRSTPDEIVIAMLGLNKRMQQLVATFRETLKLSAAPDAKWREDILETSKRRIKLEHTEEKRRKRKELKDQKAQTRNRVEWLKEHKPDAAVEVELETTVGVELEAAAETDVIETNDAEVHVAEISQVNKLDNSLDKLKRSKPEKLQKQQQANDKSKKPETGQKAINQQSKREPRQKQKEPPKARTEKKQRPTQRDLVNDKPKEDKQWPRELNIEPKKAKKEEKPRPTHVVDPFFITESGQPYLSTAVVLSDDSNNESDEDDHYMQQHRRKPLAKKQEHNDTRAYNHNDRQPSWFANQEHNDTRAYNHNDRHPSWMAKQQQKPIIASFKGTKTKFSEDGSATKTAPTPTAAQVATPVADSAVGMHPSWVAKQRLKPKIAAFAGTKIKFDD